MYEGTLLYIKGPNVVTIRTADGQNHTLGIAHGATVTRNGATVLVTELKPDDFVRLHGNPATKVEANSPATRNQAAAAQPADVPETSKPTPPRRPGEPTPRRPR